MDRITLSTVKGMDVFLEVQRHFPGSRSCGLCGKSLKYPVGIFPSRHLPDIVEEVCSNCNALFCHECSLNYPRHRCPKCGADALVAVHDEDAERVVHLFMSSAPAGPPVTPVVSPAFDPDDAIR